MAKIEALVGADAGPACVVSEADAAASCASAGCGGIAVGHCRETCRLRRCLAAIDTRTWYSAF